MLVNPKKRRARDHERRKDFLVGGADTMMKRRGMVCRYGQENTQQRAILIGIYNSMGFSAVPTRWTGGTVLGMETMEEVAAMSRGSFIVVG